MTIGLKELLEKADKKLVGVHPLIAAKARQLITNAYKEGINIIIAQGLRTIEEQNALYAQGRTKPGKIVTNARGGYSYHNFGLAFDFAVLNPDGSVNWNVDAKWKRVGQLGKSIGLEWGGDWTSFKDYPHFQMTFGLSLADLRAGKKPPEYKVASEKEEQKEEVRMYQPSNKTFLDATKTVLARLEKKGEKSISPVHREKLNKGELSLDDAVGVIFLAIKDGLIQGEKK